MPHQLVMALRTARSELTHNLPLLLAVMIGSLFPGSLESDRKSSFQTVQKSGLLGASPSLPPGPTGQSDSSSPGPPGPSAHASFTGSVSLIFWLERRLPDHTRHMLFLFYFCGCWSSDLGPWIGQVSCPPLSYP